MTIEEFLNAPISDLAKASGIAKENIWRYLNGQALTEKTLNRLSKGLDMPSYKVLEAVVMRRKKNCINLQPCANLD
jgi:transcriptional regulator with XRE-family HTH domain